jgi:hypothetical protein
MGMLGVLASSSGIARMVSLFELIDGVDFTEIDGRAETVPI